MEMTGKKVWTKLKLTLSESLVGKRSSEDYNHVLSQHAFLPPPYNPSPTPISSSYDDVPSAARNDFSRCSRTRRDSISLLRPLKDAAQIVVAKRPLVTDVSSESSDEDDDETGNKPSVKFSARPMTAINAIWGEWDGNSYEESLKMRIMQRQRIRQQHEMQVWRRREELRSDRERRLRESFERRHRDASFVHFNVRTHPTLGRASAWDEPSIASKKVTHEFRGHSAGATKSYGHSASDTNVLRRNLTTGSLLDRGEKFRMSHLLYGGQTKK